MRTVYFEVGNTIALGFTSGIQRVTRELAKRAGADGAEYNHNYVPVVFDGVQHKWRRLTPHEQFLLLTNSNTRPTVRSRISRRLRKLVPVARSLTIDPFEKSSIFLDIESSWHATNHRKQLLPQLSSQGIKIVKVHYDLIPVMFSATCHPTTVQRFIDHLHSHIKYADLFLCISKASENDIMEYCKAHRLNTPELTTFRLGSNFINSADESTSDSKSNARKVWGRYLLIVGTIEPRKNHKLLLAAFEKIKSEADLNMLIVGRVGWLTDDLMREIRSHPDYGTRIHHLQNVSDKDLVEYYRSAWLNVVPSLYEGFGLPVVEALSLGCPTICANVPSLREIGGDHVDYFDSESVDQLASMIFQLNEDANKYEALLTRTNNYESFSWQEAVAHLDQVLATHFELE